MLCSSYLVMASQVTSLAEFGGQLNGFDAELPELLETGDVDCEHELGTLISSVQQPDAEHFTECGRRQGERKSLSISYPAFRR